MPRYLKWALAFFVVHAALRFAGLSNPMFYPLAMVLLWPLPWLLAKKPERQAMGFRKPVSARWWLLGPLVAAGGLVVCAALAWGVYGSGDANWFVQHAHAMRESMGHLPAGASVMAGFWAVTVPAMLFSPLAEEFFYRGLLLHGMTEQWNFKTGQIIQASLFALVHLAHYGLAPLQPLLLIVWLPSMFGLALMFGWMVRRSGSVWVAVVAHSIFNLGMNGLVFLWLPDVIGIPSHF